MAIIQVVAYEYETGRILFYNEGDEHALVFPINPDFGWADGRWDADTHYIVDGQAIPRPTTGLPATHAIPASTDWTIPDVPAGTEVDIDGEVMGITDETGLTLSFDTPGVWPVTLRPPFPWIEASCEVTVT